MSGESNNNINPAKRLDWVDFAKGLTLILVVIGHSVFNYETGSIVRGVIFSFHMPVFFIVSCITSKWSADLPEYIRNLKRSAKHLLIPAISTYLILLIVDIIRDPSLFVSSNFWRSKLYTLILSSGVKTEFSTVQAPTIGMIWFFFVLFAAKALFDFLHLKLEETHLLIASMIIGITGILIGNVYWLPFSLDIALAVIPFMYFGYKLRSINLNEYLLRRLIISFIIWAAIIYLTFPDWQKWTYLELAIRRYPLFPLCYIGAISGAVFIFEAAILCCRARKVFLPLIILGRNSIYFFCIHILDSIWRKMFYTSGHQFITAGKRLLIDLLLFAVVMLAKYLLTKILKHGKVTTADK